MDVACTCPSLSYIVESALGTIPTKSNISILYWHQLAELPTICLDDSYDEISQD